MLRVRKKEGLLLLGEKLVFDPQDAVFRFFHIHSYPVGTTDNGSSIIATMGNGKMILFIRKKGFAGISDPDLLIGKIGEKILQEESSGQVLQSFFRVCNIPVQGHIPFEEIFRFFYFPYPEPGGFVDLLLKKNRHSFLIPVYFAGLNKNEDK